MATEPTRQGQPRVSGRRTIRHVVMVTDDEEIELQTRAEAEGVTVARLLMDTTLGAPKASWRAVLRELSGVRRIISSEVQAITSASRSANAGHWSDDEWDQVRSGIEWQNRNLAKLYGWVK